MKDPEDDYEVDEDFSVPTEPLEEDDPWEYGTTMDEIFK